MRNNLPSEQPRSGCPTRVQPPERREVRQGEVRSSAGCTATPKNRCRLQNLQSEGGFAGCTGKRFGSAESVKGQCRGSGSPSSKGRQCRPALSAADRVEYFLSVRIELEGNYDCREFKNHSKLSESTRKLVSGSWRTELAADNPDWRP